MPQLQVAPQIPFNEFRCEWEWSEGRRCVLAAWHKGPHAIHHEASSMHFVEFYTDEGKFVYNGPEYCGACGVPTGDWTHVNSLVG